MKVAEAIRKFWMLRKMFVISHNSIASEFWFLMVCLFEYVFIKLMFSYEN